MQKENNIKTIVTAESKYKSLRSFCLGCAFRLRLAGYDFYAEHGPQKEEETADF
jgi:hypothetical protein